MPRVKGTTFRGRINYVERHHGSEALETVLSQLKDQESAASLRKRVLPSGWYDFETFVDLLETVDKVCGKGDGTLFRPMAAQVAQDDLSTVYRAFFRIASPGFIIKKASQVWRQYYDSGELVVMKSDHGIVDLEVRDFPNPHIAHCESIAGWIEQCIRMTGADGVTVKHCLCRARGDERCLFELRWR